MCKNIWWTFTFSVSIEVTILHILCVKLIEIFFIPHVLIPEGIPEFLTYFLFVGCHSVCFRSWWLYYAVWQIFISTAVWTNKTPISLLKRDSITWYVVPFCMVLFRGWLHSFWFMLLYILYIFINILVSLFVSPNAIVMNNISYMNILTWHIQSFWYYMA